MDLVHQERIVPAYIETGQVVDVDIETFTVSVVTQYTQKLLTGIGFATPYQHHANGEGIYFMPEVSSLCWLCFPSDGSRPFILAWAPAREDNGSLRAKKMGLNPGDIYLGTRDENFIILRRGGVLQIGGGPLSQRMFLPINNTIKDFCENYSLFTLGGDLEWSIDRSETTTDGKRPASLRIKAREYANDTEPIAVLEIGSHKDSAKNILSLVIKESGSPGSATKISLAFQKDGSATWSFKGSVTWSVKENLTVSAEKNLTLSAGQAATLKGASVVVEATTTNTKIHGMTTVDITAGASVTVSPQLTVGGAGAKEVLLADPYFLQWMMTHRHIGVQSGNSMSGPPTPWTGTGHLSQKLKSK